MVVMVVLSVMFIIVKMSIMFMFYLGAASFTPMSAVKCDKWHLKTMWTT